MLLLSFGFLLHALNAVHATKVFLSPAPTNLPTRIPSRRAGLALAQHLGLEKHESLIDYDFGEETFVGLGEKRGVLLSADDKDLKGTRCFCPFKC
jgi:hypothetical protein